MYEDNHSKCQNITFLKNSAVLTHGTQKLSNILSGWENQQKYESQSLEIKHLKPVLMDSTIFISCELFKSGKVLAGSLHLVMVHKYL